MLYKARKQLFSCGNKRTSMIIANKVMIENGAGMIIVLEENIIEFNKLLTDFYYTNDDMKIIEFVYNNCIFGIDYNN